MSDESAEVETTSDVTATPESEPAPEATVESTTEPSLDEELSATWDKANRPRGADGKFAARDSGNEEQAAAEEGSETESESGQPEVEEAATETPSVEPPSSWPDDKKERFLALPPEFHDIAEFVAQRDQEQGEALDRIGQEVYAVEQAVMQYEPFDQVTQAFQEDIARRGIHPAQAFHFLLNAQRTLDQNPLGGLVQIGRSYNIDLEPLLRSAGVQVQLPQQAPQVEPYVAALQSKVQQLEGIMTAQQQAQYQAEEQRLSSVIEDFAKGKPYFDEVRPVMAALLQGGQATDLAQAYDMAINASPTVRARVQQEARKAAEAKRMAEQKVKAEAARKSTAVNVKSGTPGTPGKPKHWVDTLTEVARKHYG